MAKDKKESKEKKPKEKKEKKDKPAGVEKKEKKKKGTIKSIVAHLMKTDSNKAPLRKLIGKQVEYWNTKTAENCGDFNDQAASVENSKWFDGISGDTSELKKLLAGNHRSFKEKLEKTSKEFRGLMAELS